MTIDMRKYGGEYYLTVPDVRDGPLPEKIVDVRDGKYDKPDLIFETGDVRYLDRQKHRMLSRRGRVSGQAAGVGAYQTDLTTDYRDRKGRRQIQAGRWRRR
jgi:hypothetical protein